MSSKIHLFSKKNKPAVVKVEKSIFQKAIQDWKILLLSAIVLGLVIVAIDGYLLWRVNNGDIFIAETVVQNDTTQSDKKMLGGVVKFFDDRAAAFDTFKNPRKTEIDPSL